MNQHLTEKQMDGLLDPAKYTGLAAQFVDRVTEKKGKVNAGGREIRRGESTFPRGPSMPGAHALYRGTQVRLNLESGQGQEGKRPISLDTPRPFSYTHVGYRGARTRVRVVPLEAEVFMPEEKK